MASEYLSKNSTTTSTTKFTFSGWVKRASFDSRHAIFATDAVTNSNQADNLGGSGILFAFWNDNRLGFTGYGGTVTGYSSAIYRDSSAFYHCVLAFDSTQATSSERVRMWVNGDQITSWNSYIAPNQNKDVKFAKHRIGAGMDKNAYSDDDAAALTYFLNGSMFDVYVIEGQSLSASTFGKLNSITGQWVPKHPTVVKQLINSTGGFGDNGAYLPMNENNDALFSSMYSTDAAGKTLAYSGIANAVPSGFSKAKRSSWYAPNSGNNPTIQYPNNSDFAFGTGDYTLEGWFAWETWSGTEQRLFLYGQAGTSIIEVGRGSAANNLYVIHNGSTVISYAWTPTLNTYYHIAVVRNSGTVRLYINGSQVQADASAGSSGNLANTGSNFEVGGLNWANSYHIRGWLDSVRIVKGQCLYPSGTSFTPAPLLSSTTYSINGGSTSSAITGTVGACFTPDFKLFGTDESGAGYTHGYNNGHVGGVSNFRGDKHTPDTITNNFCTFMKVNSHYSTSITKGGLVLTNSNGAQWQQQRASHIFSSGKYYWETKLLQGNLYAWIGVQNADDHTYDPANVRGGDPYSTTYGYQIDGRYWTANTASTGNPTSTTGDIMMLAVDVDSGKLWFGKNGTWFGSGNPVTGASQHVTIPTGKTYIPVSNLYGSPTHQVEVNFGQGGIVTSNNGNGYADGNNKGKFQYQPPSGFLALCEDNIPDLTSPAAINPQNYFNSVVYSGAGTTSTHVQPGFAPDIALVKSLSTTSTWYMFDRVRGDDKGVYTNINWSEENSSVAPYYDQSFTSTGFNIAQTAAGGNEVNAPGNNHLAICWKAGGAPVTNTAGTRTSQVSANTTSGISVVTFDIASASGEDTVGHGLGAKPDVIIMKSRNNSYNWDVWHKGLGGITNTLILNASDTVYSNRQPFTASTEPTANVFSIRNAFYTANATFVAYCFKEIPGFSKYGSYFGNASESYGVFVYTGFRPKCILAKPYNTINNWTFFDSAVDTKNNMGTLLRPNMTDGVLSSAPRVDFLSNGFKMYTSGLPNDNAGNIFMAWADQPFDFANPR